MTEGTTRAHRVLAPNPGPMTLDGTNTWILTEPGAEVSIVIDPGPEHEGHLRAVLDAAPGRVGLILLTHGHLDHAEGARTFAEMAGSIPVRALDPAFRLGDEGLAEGDVVTAGGLELRVMETPGHSPDSLCFWLPADRAILTGDTVMGYGTTMVDKLGDYLESLQRLRTAAVGAGPAKILPGHGPVLDDPVGALDYYISHREERLAEVRAALAAGARTPAEIVDRVYTDIDPGVRAAAEWSVTAQLEYLRSR